jgi:signal transduction histidine kinase
VATTLDRIVQEALLNIVKHARGRPVDIVLTRQNGKVAVVIEIDGRGFEQQPKRESGLRGIRDRAALAGGQLTIESQPGTGTVLRIEIPLA